MKIFATDTKEEEEKNTPETHFTLINIYVFTILQQFER